MSTGLGHDVLDVIALITLVLLSGFFSGSEVSMMSINRFRLRHQANQGQKTAKLILKLLKKPDKILGVILIGNTFANVLASSLATVVAVRIWGSIGVFIASVGLTLIILIFAEMSPKNLSAHFPNHVGQVVAWPLWLLLKFFYPIVWLGTWVANGFLVLCGVPFSQAQNKDQLNAEELKTVVHESMGMPEEATDQQQDASLSKQSHKDMLLGVLELDQMNVDDVMLTKDKVVGIDIDQSWVDIKQQILNIEYNRVPVYRGGLNSVEGILYVRDLVSLFDDEGLFSMDKLLSLLHEPYFIPEGTSLNTQLKEFRENKRPMALVVDEYGDIVGLITLSDIVEEIVGEFDFDLNSPEMLIQPYDNNSYTIYAGLSIRVINKHLDWHLPTSGPKTLSGLITEQLEMIPDRPMCLTIDNYRLEIVSLGDNKIAQVRVTPPVSTDQAAPALGTKH